MSFISGLHTRVFLSLFAFILLPALSPGQAAAAQSQSPRSLAPAFTAPDSDSAFAQKAAARGAMLGQLGKFPDTKGNGPYPATYAMAPNGMEDVVYQPADLAQVKSKLGVYIWGNGGCGYDATTARFHLIEIASHGYVAIAPGEILSGPKASKPSANATPVAPPAGNDKRATPEKMIAALDWILAENQRQGSPYYGKMDPALITFSGHSCGGLIAMKAALDPRAKALVLENSGLFRQQMGGPPADDRLGAVTRLLSQMNKEDLVKLHTPVLYILGGPQDIAEPNGLDDFQHIQHVPVFVADHPGAGHGGLFAEPNGEGTKIELDWMAWQLHNDKTAARTFTGPDCTLCRDYRWVVSRKGIN
jgi:dienelactone hydrolase